MIILQKLRIGDVIYMNAEILAVGTELLMGQIANTNAQYISKRLNDTGTNVYYHSVVGDNPQRLKDVMTLALGRSDAVIITGGLGPTRDDLTKETVSEIFGKKLVEHEQSVNKINAFFKNMNRPMVNSNYKQTFFPEGCTVMENNVGTAPGCYIEADGKVVFMLPGPPSEMKPMFEQYVIPYFYQRSNCKIVSKYVQVFGVGESSVETAVIDLIDKQSNPTIAPYAGVDVVTLRVSARCENEESPEDFLNPVIEGIMERLGDAVFTVEDETMEEVVAKLVLEKNITFAFAESCTGGNLSALITSIPGISQVFNRAIVCYSNESKIDELGVNPKTLKNFGAVSEETAIEMADGIRKKAGTDVGISITGIAGPEGGSKNKPVGLVYIGFATPDKMECKALKLRGSRSRIQNVACLHALDMLRRYAIGR